MIAHLADDALALLSATWIPVGLPGYAGPAKVSRADTLDARFGADGWRLSHVVRGRIVPKSAAIVEYEEAYRRYLRDRPALVEFVVTMCGNVYDYEVANVYDHDYEQPHTDMNHYQDISVRRVVAELVDDDAWPDVRETASETTELVDFDTGASHRVPRARGFAGRHLMQIRDPRSAGYCLNPAVVPCHDPALITTLPNHVSWFHSEGCSHLSIEAFWQMSKVVEVRYDRFVASGNDVRDAPLAGL
jgi:hypothetical protein